MLPEALPTTSAPSTTTAVPLHFARQVLAQALGLAAAHGRGDTPAYTRPVGAHLRHVIEHFEALLLGVGDGVVDYDRRPRDALLERSPALAQQRITALLRALDREDLLSDLPLTVSGMAGIVGDLAFKSTSTLSRELIFVASHAIHHFALLQPHCMQQGIAVAAEFGRAPATLAHERAAPPNHRQDPSPCAATAP
jgi:hypothetical protein